MNINKNIKKYSYIFTKKKKSHVVFRVFYFNRNTEMQSTLRFTQGWHTFYVTYVRL